MNKEKVDLILYGGNILTLNDCDEIIENGAIAVRDGRIVEVGHTSRIRERFSAKENIDAKNGIVMPGLINTHTHAAMSIFRGVADDVVLGDWLEKFIFPLEDRFIDKNSVYWGSLLSCAEMVLSGTTTFCDMYFFEEEVGSAAEKIGVRAIIGEGIVALEKDEEAWERKKDLTLKLMKKFKKSQLISVGMEPHSPYTCTENVLRKAKAFAKENDLPYIIHLAETKKEFSDFVANKKMTPVEYLDSIGVLDENTLAAHCVWVSKNDLKILKIRKVKISHCPQSNMKLGSGIAPVIKFIKSNITVSLGTDGSASNNTVDMFREMKSAALLAKVSSLDAGEFSAKETLRMATIEGAKALGREKELGSLEIGKNADIIILDSSQPHLVPLYNYYSHIVYCACASDVKTSIVNGKVVMKDRKMKNADIYEIMKKVNVISSRIRRSCSK